MGHKEALIADFSCSGCVNGSSPDSCDVYKLVAEDGFIRCENHCPGTHMMGMRSGLMCLGLPKGFCRVAGYKDKLEPHIRIHPKDTPKPEKTWNKLNVPVWAMEQDGFLFVRTFMPRIDVTVVDVVEGGTLDMVPGAINVGEFIEEID